MFVQGLLDGSAYIALLFSGTGLAGQVTAVISSCFSAITVVLACLILQENMSRRQWLGIATVLCGVAWLAWLG